MNDILAYFGLQAYSSTMIQAVVVFAWLAILAVTVFLNRKKSFVNRFDTAYFVSVGFITLAMLFGVLNPVVYVVCVSITLASGIGIALYYANKRYKASLVPSKVSFSVLRNSKSGDKLYTAKITTD